MAARASSPKVVSHLRELAGFYRGFLFDFDTLSGGDGGFVRAGALRCINELVSREKRVAVVSGTSQRASSIAKAAHAGGIPRSVGAWTSGEFVWQSLAAASPSQSHTLPASAKTLLPFLEGPLPPRIFELSSIATPKSWSDLAKRSGPPLGDLAQIGAIKRVDDVEEADACYWDLYEGDKLEALLEATLQLCVEFRVPLLHTSRSLEAARLLSTSCRRGTPEAAGASLERMGGNVLSVGKLEACTEGLGWATDFPSQDVLLVSADLGDVAEASQHSMDSLLLLGGRATSQLSAFASEAVQQKEAARRTMSMSQRVHEGTPGALSLATNPFFSVFKLPELLADATRKSVEHRQRTAAAAEAAKSAASSSSAAARAPASPPSAPSDGQPASQQETLELLERWCASAGVPVPVTALNAQLSWDGSADGRAAGVGASRPATAGASRGQEVIKKEASEGVSAPKRAEHRTSTARSRRTSSSKSRDQEPEAESLEDLLKKLKL